MLGDACCRRSVWQIAVAEAAGVSADEQDLASAMTVYKLQAELFKEDFENERQDHQRTKAQVESLMVQWNSLHDELRRCRAEVRCGVDVMTS